MQLLPEAFCCGGSCLGSDIYFVPHTLKGSAHFLFTVGIVSGSIKPGLTGMWQVNGRSLVTDFEKIVELDVEYIDNWSLMEDIRILCKTVTVLLKHADAY